MTRRHLLEQLVITEEQRKQVHEFTIGQRDNPHWQMFKKGRLSASNFGPVLNAKQVTQSLIKRVLGQYDLSGVHTVQWGIINESEGKKAFEQKAGVMVEESGLWLETSGILGASPDGLVGSNALLEVKCPLTQRDCTISEAVESGDFYIEKSDGRYNLNEEHNYRHQVQGQLHLTNRDICYFVVWTTKQSLILSIRRDPTWVKILPVFKNFYMKHIIPAFINDNL